MEYSHFNRTGYAADGYARIKGMGALITTYGVGELSAINAVAGSYVEHVPVVQITGSPSLASRKKNDMLQHELGNGNFDAYADMYKHITVAQALLRDPENVTAQIDDCLKICWWERRPVYIDLPADLVALQVDGSVLDHPLELERPKNDEKMEITVVDMLLQRLDAAKSPMLLVDRLVESRRLGHEVASFVQTSKLPTFSTRTGKGCVDESLPNYAGIYAGKLSDDHVRKFVESSDLVLWIGPIKSSLNTIRFTFPFDSDRTIDLYPNHTTVNGQTHELHLSGILQRLTSRLASHKLTFYTFKARAQAADLTPASSSSDLITHAYLWPALSSNLLPSDILVLDIGTCTFGAFSVSYPYPLTEISMPFWSSIGYALPAAQGAATAARELTGKRRRIILFQGDGSLQMTAQAIGTILNHNLDIIVFLINNDGYTVERYLHGMTATYNDISKWRYSELPRAMGAHDGNAKSHQVRTVEQLEELWSKDEFKEGKGLQFVEIFMEKEDAPDIFKRFASLAT